MSKEELEQLVTDLEKNGLQDKIVLHEGKVLDGRNRILALGRCLHDEDFIQWRDVYEYADDNVLAWVVSKNLHRRHLTTSQRAAIAAELVNAFAEEAKQRQGTRTDIKASLPESSKAQAREQAAKVMHVSPRIVSDAKKVAASSPELHEEVKQGKKTVHAALKEAKEVEKPAAPQDDGVLTKLQSSLIRIFGDGQVQVATSAIRRFGNTAVCPQHQYGRFKVSFLANAKEIENLCGILSAAFKREPKKVMKHFIDAQVGDHISVNGVTNL